VLFNSNPVEFKPDSVVIDVAGSKQEIPNDFVWIFAGGAPAYAFLKNIGVGFGGRDITQETRRSAMEADSERKRIAYGATAPSH